MKNRLREELEAMLELHTGDSFTADNVHTLVNGIFAADEGGGGFEFVEYDNNAFPYPQTIGKTAPSITGLGPADESMIDTIFIMPNKETDPDATLMIVVDEKDPSTDPKTYQYVYVGNINDLPSDVLTEGSIVNDLSTGGTDKPLSAEQGRTLNSHVNYVTCGSGAADQVKLISDDGFELSTHLRLLVKMTNTNTNSTPKFNINNTGIKDVWYNSAVASDTNTWSAGEVLDVYYDGTSYIATTYGGAQFATGEKVKNVSIDDEPTAGSDNLVKSGGVYEKVSQLDQKMDNTGTYNLTKAVPLESGYYQMSDSTAANYAPNAVPLNIRTPGLTITFRSAEFEWQNWQYISYNNIGWLNLERWKKLANFEDTKEWKSTIFNLSKEIPLQSGYYQLVDSSAANFAPNAIPSSVRTPGLIITFRTEEFFWQVWQYNSYNTAGWNIVGRWKRIDETNIDVVPVTYANSINYTGNISANITQMLYTGLVIRIKLPYPVYKDVPQFRLNSNSTDVYGGNVYKDIVNVDGTAITLTSMRLVGKEYELLYNGTNWTLLNPDDIYDIELSNILGKSIVNDLEIGGITTGGVNSMNVARIRTKGGILYKTPLKLHIKPGYQLFYEFKINPLTSEVTYESELYKTGIYNIPEDNLLRRFMFKKTDGSNFTNVEDVANIVSIFADDELQDANSDRLDMTNSETLLLIGTSHTEGNGSLKDKSMASYVSALTDWNVINLGAGGSNYLKHYTHLLDGFYFVGLNWTYVKSGGVCLDFLCGNADNIFTETPYDGKYVAENMKRLYSLIKTKGFDIIAGSYWGDQSISLTDVQRKVAKEEHLPVLNLNSECYRINDKRFSPFWYSGHFASRTVANQFYTLLQKYHIRRPKKAIKVFRNRNAGASINDLLYDDVFERLKNWRELSVGHRAITDGKENYVDRLDLYVSSGYDLTNAPLEYNALRAKTGVTFADKALIELIFPSTATQLSNIKIYIETTAISPSVYVMKRNDISLEMTLTPAQAVFVIPVGVTGISVGDIFTDTLNDGVMFTVADKDETTNKILCSASGTFSTPGQTTDTLTRSSDSATFTATSLTSGVPTAYPSEAYKPFGKWESLTLQNGYYVIDTPTDYMEYDKIAILVDNSETQFNISDIYVTYNKTGEKCIEPTVTENYPDVNGTTLLEDNFSSTSGIVDSTNGSYTWNGNETYTGTGDTSVTKNHIPPYYYNKGATNILHLKSGDSVTYNVDGFTSGDYRIMIVCRYFPASNLDVSASTFTVTPNSFDFGKLGIRYNIGESSNMFTDERYVPASFVELKKDIHLDSLHTGKSLQLLAIDNDVEILYVKMESLNR